MNKIAYLYPLESKLKSKTPLAAGDNDDVRGRGETGDGNLGRLFPDLMDDPSVLDLLDDVRLERRCCTSLLRLFRVLSSRFGLRGTILAYPDSIDIS